VSPHIVIVPEIGNLDPAPKNLAARLHASVRAALQAGAREVVGRVKELAPRDTGRLANSTDSVLNQSGDELSATIFSRVRYSLFVHDGARYRDKMPPPAALLAWARRHLAKGLVRARLAAGQDTKNFRPKVAKDDALSLAFALAKAIKRRGFIKGRPYMRQGLEQKAARVGALIQQAATRALGGTA
jgi:hypothetical protein